MPIHFQYIRYKNDIHAREAQKSVEVIQSMLSIMVFSSFLSYLVVIVFFFRAFLFVSF